MTWRKRLNLPKEHGAWAMLYVPFVLGALVAGRWTVAVWCLLLCVSALFISRESLLLWWRARKRGRTSAEAAQMLWLYGGSAALSGLPLVLWWRFDWLVPFGLLGLGLLLFNGAQGAQLEERSLRNELLAIAGLTMTAPAAYAVAAARWDNTALWLWALSIGYFASSVFFIKHTVASVHAKAHDMRERIRWSCLTYHLFLLVGLAALALSGSLSLFVLIAFLPALARAFWSIFSPPRQLNLKRAGILEIGYSLLFLAFVAYGFWLQ
jgi:hypothetical protein